MSGEAGVAVVGSGGHGKVVVSTLLAAGFPLAGVFDHDPERWGKTVLGVEIIGSIAELSRSAIVRAVLAIGDNRTRERVADQLAEAGLDWQAVVHPSATVDASVRLGHGSVVFAGAVIQPATRIGAHAIVNTSSSVDHDCRLGDLVHIAPGAHVAGGVTIGIGASLGVGCSVLPGVTIGEWAVVGAGAAVISDVGANAIVKGVPAR